MKIKFAHLADIHLGAWRNENLNQIGFQAAEIATDKIIQEKVDFVLISGDLYDLSNPRVEVVDLATKLLKKLKDNGIRVYGILGSHDFSPSNRSMIRPLVTAELFTSVSRAKWTDSKKLQLIFTQDPKTKIKITGLRARKRGLEIREYKILDLKKIEEETGIKIFLFHTMIYELKPKDFDYLASAPKRFFPKNFHYYAGGHLHQTYPLKLRTQKSPLSINQENNIIYPGSLSPINFSELDMFQYGGFCMVSGEINEKQAETNLKVEYIPIKVKEVVSIDVNGNKKTIEQVKKIINNKLSKAEVKNKVILMKIHGSLSSGRASQINISDIKQDLKSKGAYEVLIKKTITSSEVIEINKTQNIQSNEEIEDAIIRESTENIDIADLPPDIMEKKITQLIEVLGEKRNEKMKVKDYKKDIEIKALKLFNLDNMEGSFK